MKKIIVFFVSLFLIISNLIHPTNAEAEQPHPSTSTGLNFENILIEVPDEVSLEDHKAGKVPTDIDFSNVKKIVPLNLTFKRVYEVTLKDNSHIKSDMASMVQSQYINKVHPNFIYTSAATPANACTINQTWHLGANYLNYNYISELYGAYRVLVGVVDTGISTTHVETKGRINTAKSYNFVSNTANANDDATSGHGTHVASIIGGSKMGLNRKVDFVAYKVLDKSGNGSTSNIVRAINQATKDGVPILNMSLGMPASYGIDALLYAAIKNYPGLVVAASGNSALTVADYPAGFDLRNIISVNSVDNQRALSWFAHKNATQIDIAGYGTDICAADAHNDNGYVVKSGSSMATPMVTAGAAMLLTQNPNLSPAQLKGYILDGNDYDSKIKGTNVTSGVLDIVDSMEIFQEKTGITNAMHFVSSSDSNQLVLYGLNDFGQLGTGDFNARTQANPITIKIPGEQIAKYFLTRRNTFIITKSGKVYVAGDNSVGQVNNSGGKSSSFRRFQSPIADKIIDIDFRNTVDVFDEMSIRYIIKRGQNAKWVRVGEKTVVYRSTKLATYRDPVVVIYTNNINTDRIYYVNGKKYNVQSKKFDNSGVLLQETYTTYRKDAITTQQIKYKNGQILSNVKEVKNGAGKMVERNALTYQQKKSISANRYVWRSYKLKQVITNYKNGQRSKETVYQYNNAGQLRTNKNGKAYRRIRTYVNGKQRTSQTRNYTSKGKLAKAS